MEKLATEVYYSSCEVLVDTQRHGVIDVSDDVKSVSVSRRMDAISTANVSIVNYAGYKNGMYSNVIHVGDRVHVAYFKGSRRIDQFTGRVSKVPVVTFQKPTFDFTCQDCIADLNYIWWDPFSAAAYKKYTYDAYKLVNDSSSSAYTDSASGQRLNQFLMEVCKFPSNAVKIANFPNLTDITKAIIDIAKRNTDRDPNDMAAELYNMLFGQGNNFTPVGNDIVGSNASSSGGITETPAQKFRRQEQQQFVDGINALMNLFGPRGYKDASEPRIWFLRDGFYDDWKGFTGERHTGKYGLSKRQMKKHAHVNKEAFQCTPAQQDNAIASIMEAIAGNRGRSNYLSNLVWFYLFGNNYHVNGKGHNATISYNGTGVQSLSVGNKKNTIVYGWQWTKAIGASGNGVSLVRGKRMYKDLGGYTHPTGKGSAGGNAMADRFNDWVNKTRGHYVNPDGAYGAQCWDLFLYYCSDFLGIGFPPRQPAPARGRNANARFWDEFPQNAKMSDNFQKISPDQRFQAGDVVFWARGHDASYGHVSIVLSDDGNRVLTFSQNPNAPDNIWENKANAAGAIRPKALGGVPGKYTGPTGLGSSNGSTSPIGGQGSDYQLEGPANQFITRGEAKRMSEAIAKKKARNESFKLFKFVNLGSPQDILAAEMYQGKLLLKNDRPAIEFVKSLCQSSMRSFMSLPDGSFAAFVPDWWGIYKQPGINTVIEIPAIDVINFQADIDKSSYVSHFFLNTAEFIMDPSGLTGTQAYLTGYMQDMNSSGTITMQDYANQLAPLMDISATGYAAPGRTTGTALQTLMQNWGVNVVTKTDNYIVNSTMTTISALTQFLKYWANCFHTTATIAFRPEIMPGHRLHFPDAHCTLFVETVTHSWTATGGGSTQVTVVAPVTDSGQVGIIEQ